MDGFGTRLPDTYRKGNDQNKLVDASDFPGGSPITIGCPSNESMDKAPTPPVTTHNNAAIRQGRCLSTNRTEIPYRAVELLVSFGN